MKAKHHIIEAKNKPVRSPHRTQHHDRRSLATTPSDGQWGPAPRGGGDPRKPGIARAELIAGRQGFLAATSGECITWATNASADEARAATAATPAANRIFCWLAALKPRLMSGMKEHPKSKFDKF